MEVGLFSDASGEQSCVTAYNLSTGVTLKSFKNGACASKGLALVQDEYLIAVQHGKQIIHIYDMDKDSLVKKIVCSEKIKALTVTPDGQFVVAALLDKIHIWQLSSGHLYCVLTRHYQDIVGLQFTNDGKFFLSYGNDNLIIVWDLNSVLQSCVTSQHTRASEQRHKPLHVLSNHSMSVQDAHMGVVGATRAHFATCSLDQTCKIFEVSSGKLLKNFIFDVGCTAVCMDVCERWLFVGLMDGRIAIINCYQQEQGQDVQVENSCYIKAHKKAVTCVRASMDGQHIVSGGKDSLVKVWHIASRKCVRSFEFKDEVTNIQLHPSFIFPNNNNNKQHSTARTKRVIGNFQRSVYTPTTYNSVEEMFSGDITPDTIPVLLRDLRHDDDDDETKEEKKTSYLEEVLREFYYSQGGVAANNNNNNNNGTATSSRQELQRRVVALEAMTEELYKTSTQRLLKSFNGDTTVNDDRTDDSMIEN